jgi:hypothetical protein
VYTQNFLLDGGRKGGERADHDATNKKFMFDFNNYVTKISS